MRLYMSIFLNISWWTCGDLSLAPSFSTTHMRNHQHRYVTRIRQPTIFELPLTVLVVFCKYNFLGRFFCFCRKRKNEVNFPTFSTRSERADSKHLKSFQRTHLQHSANMCSHTRLCSVSVGYPFCSLINVKWKYSHNWVWSLKWFF